MALSWIDRRRSLADVDMDADWGRASHASERARVKDGRHLTVPGGVRRRRNGSTSISAVTCSVTAAHQRRIGPVTTVHEMIGRLTLADAMLGEAVNDFRDMIATANWPGTVKPLPRGDTTAQAVEKLERDLVLEAAFASPGLVRRMGAVRAATIARNALIHAIAADQCLACGEATRFTHPRSGKVVDRSVESVASVKATFDDLRAQAKALGSGLAEAVNHRILRAARVEANRLDDVINPPQVNPLGSDHWCAKCGGVTIVHGGCVR